MTPEVNVDGRERAGYAPSATAPASIMPSERTETTATRTQRELTEAERQGLAMGWVALILGMFLLLGGLALWASVALGASFGWWLLCIAVMGVIAVASLAAIGSTLVRHAR